MKDIIDVLTGDVKVCRAGRVLVSNAIGSCVAVLAVDIKKKTGGIAHVMLPGRAPQGLKKKTLYAENAVIELLAKMRKFGAAKKNVKVFIAGGANVLKLKGCNIGRDNIDSIIDTLKINEYSIRDSDVGGTIRRKVRLDVANSTVTYNKGKGKDKVFR